MMRLNILSSLAGNIWIALLTLAATPAQLHLLGVEAYGLVSVIALLQVVLSTLDLGLSSVTIRVVAAENDGRMDRGKNLINTIGTIYWSMAIAIAVVLGIGSGWLSLHWLQASQIKPSTLQAAIQLIALYLGLRWPIAFYSGVLAGLRRMEILNGIRAAAATARLGLGTVLIFIWPNALVLLAWFVLAAAAELLAYAIVAHRLAPALRFRPSFRPGALKSEWKFAASMGVIALTAVLLTQIDKTMISKMLSLHQFGYYTLAYQAAASVSLLQTSINGVALPSLTAAHSRSPDDLVPLFEKTSQVTGFIVTLPCLMLMFFGQEIATLWVGAGPAAQIRTVLALLSIGFLLNALVSTPYIVAVALGRPQIPLVVNITAFVVYVPTVYILIRTAGVEGAAVGWILINAFYLASLLPLIQTRILGRSMWPWLMKNWVPFVGVAIVVIGGARLLTAVEAAKPMTFLLLIASCLVYTGIAFRLLSRELRYGIQAAAFGGLRQVFKR
jgi:O-antigen/teichoic acid export membrane protein